MPKRDQREEADDILRCISLFHDGATIRQIAQILTPALPRRTLQRRLTSLQKKELLLVEGQSRSRRYRLTTVPKPSTPDKSVVQTIEPFIPLSPFSQEIQNTVSLPVHVRKHVSYRREFLDTYQPNITAYLPQSLSAHLNEIGKTDGPRPIGTYAKQIVGRLLIDLSWNSSRLEGNTYSLLETERLVEMSEAAEGKDAQETQMILNHKMAIEFLIESVETIGLNRYTILNLHALLSNNLLPHSENCGRLRTIPVGVAETVYHPTAIPPLIEECFQIIIDKAAAIANPFEQAFFLMVHLPYLQPFEDVNKRVSRLACNIPLILQNLCPLSFVDVPKQLYISGHLGVYELNRIDLLRDLFAWAYERSCLLYSTTCQTLGQPDPFRMKYRQVIYDTVTQVVQEQMNKKIAIETIKQKSLQLPSVEEKERFIQSVETELRALHEGNIARYRLRQSAFELWKNHWL